MFVLHPSGGPAREYVGGRIVDFDETGAAEDGVPHVVEHYAATGYTTYQSLEEWGGLDVTDDPEPEPELDEPGDDDDAA